MELARLLKDIDVLDFSGLLHGEVSAVCHDSRQCTDGSLFVAVPGFKSDGHDFINAAIAQGARYVLLESNVAVADGVTAIRVADSRRSLGIVARNFFEDPSARLNMVGVTGTNGKTTVTFLLESIIKAAGAMPGVVGTINYRYDDKTLVALNTTPESLELQRILREMADAGVTHVVMEVSSHALELGRVADCHFQSGIFTNLTQDHLDYHQTMESYFRAKKKLFEMLVEAGAGQRAFINSDDPWGVRLRKEIAAETGVELLTFGLSHEADVMAENPILSADGICASIRTATDRFEIWSPLMGKFNLYNILSAVAAAHVMGLPVEAIRHGVASLQNVPGRMERVSLPGEAMVFVDYAHTDDALRRVLQNIMEFKTGRVITVFGCGGDRDRGKRPLMGRAATTYSDLTVLTTDNPRSEPPEAILQEIEAGIAPDCERYAPNDLKSACQGPKGYAVIADRQKAIEAAIAAAGASDIVLVAGKGHETYQIIGSKILPFDDRRVCRQALDALRPGGMNA